MFHPTFKTIIPSMVGLFATIGFALSDDASRYLSYHVRQVVKSAEKSELITASTATIISSGMIWLLIMASITLLSVIVCRATVLRCPRGHGRVQWQLNLLVHGAAQLAMLVLLYWTGLYRPLQIMIQDLLYANSNIITDVLYDTSALDLFLPLLTGWIVLNFGLWVASRTRTTKDIPTE